MWSGDVDNVSNTQIFAGVVYPARVETKHGKARKVPDGKAMQMVIVSNTVQIPALDKYDLDVPGVYHSGTAMIIPVPLVSGENRIKVVDISDYPRFFEDIDMVFPLVKTDSFQDLIREDLDDVNTSSYDVRIVRRVDGIAPDLADMIKRYYSSGFAFVVARTTSGNRPIRYKPFAYVHELRSDGRLFIPTRTYFRKRGTNPYSRYHSTEPSNPVQDVNDHIYGTLMADDAWMSMVSRRKDLAATRERLSITRDHEIYVINFPRLRKNTTLQQPGFQITSGDLNRLVNFYSYVETSKLPIGYVLSRPRDLFKIRIDNNCRHNFDLYL